MRAEILEEGVRVHADPDRVVDVSMDGRRIWSFRTGVAGREATVDADGLLSVAWPGALRPLLRGVTEAVLTDGGVEVARRELRFPGSEERTQVVDREGRPLVVGPNGKLMLSFGDHQETAQAMLAAARRVLEVMADQGLGGFLAYGTLLGAVREGAFIGHDNDLDLGYVSAHAQPVDVVAESLRLQHALARAGMSTERYSGAGLKIWVTDEGGVRRGLDVFGGFWHGDRLAFLGELLTPFERDWVEPLSTVQLEGETFPAPARPEKLLEAMYGPGWRVPDPTFVFEPGTDAREWLNRWFRGIRWHRNEWDAWYAPGAKDSPLLKPHQLARIVHDAEPGATVVDVGCGRGRDAVWLAERGHRVVALDYSAPAMRYLARESAEQGLPIDFHCANLLELRHALVWGARIARMDGPRVIMARHVVNATVQRGREGLWRMASMGLRGGGRLYLEFLGSTEPRKLPKVGKPLVWEIDPEVLAAEARRHGGEVREVSWFDMNSFEVPPRMPDWDPAPRACRMVVEF
ncbi:class I SAM-dependent methyltransferase [Nocardioides sp. GY 10113]|uniref:class I SAM-dependent methyltransferase n=1 Tax=Nocardioides sp. GY 10113 TaxID=2569761 RepID=UPI001458C5DA|nr:class I SAM-dependent methyltransferase [Nocardioides sp. GY 10113]